MMEPTYEIIDVYPDGTQVSLGLMVGFKEACDRADLYRKDYPEEDFFVVPYRPYLEI